MRIRNYIFALLAAGVLVLPGCKKDDDDDTPSIYGTIQFDELPAYVLKGDSFHITATGAYRGSDKTDTLVGYYMYNSMTALRDTIRKENQSGVAEGDFVVDKDTTGTFTFSIYAFAKGYYGNSASCTFTVVNPVFNAPGSSITGHPFEIGVTSILNDARDGRLYYASSTASGAWMLNNLAWNGAGVPFADADAMSYISGRFYSWEEATAACPVGWKLPSDADFVALAGAGSAGETIPGKAGMLKGDVCFNGTAMWPFTDISVTITNESMFTAMPWGYMTTSAGIHSFKSVRNMAAFWTADSVDADNARVRYVLSDSNDIFVQAMDKKSFGASVRCIKE